MRLMLAVLVLPTVNGHAQTRHCASDNAGLTLPRGFCAQLFAERVGLARHIAVVPNGDVLVVLLDRGGPTGILLLRDTNGDGVADLRVTVLEDSAATDVAIWTGDGRTYLYYATYNEIIRFRWRVGGVRPVGLPDTIVRGLPGAQDYGTRHGIKTMAFGPDDRLYVNIGAPSNSCQVFDREPGSPGMAPCSLLDSTGGVWVFNAQRSGQTRRAGLRFATGLRNAVAIAVRPATSALYGVVHGRDELSRLWGFSDSANAETPAEEFVHIEMRDDFGWPYCYYDPRQNRKVLAPEYGGDGYTVGRCAAKKDPLIAFPAHWAPNGVHFYSGSLFPQRYRHGAFIAFHGSWNRAPLPQAGYKVVFVPFRGSEPLSWEIFADGFRDEGAGRYARPVDVAEGPDGSLYISDSEGGRVYRITYASAN